MIATGASNPLPVPLNYMILRAEGQSRETGQTLEDKGLKLTITAEKCSYTASEPNDATNLAVSTQFLARFSSSAKEAAKSAKDKPAKTSTTTETQAGGSVSAVAEGASDSKYTEPAEIGDMKIDLDDPAQQYACEQMVAGEWSWVFAMELEGKIRLLLDV